MAAGILLRAGRVDEAVPLYVCAGQAGDMTALLAAGDRLREADRPDAAAGLYRLVMDRADTAADAAALCAAADGFIALDLCDEAIRGAGWVADLGDSNLLEPLARRLWSAGRTSDAISLLQRGVRSGAGPLRSLLVDLLLQAGREEEAYGYGEQVLAEGDLTYTCAVIADYVAHGAVDTAVDMWKRAPIRDQSVAVNRIAATLPYGSIEKAAFLERLVAVAGPVPARRHAATSWAATGERDRALLLYAQAVLAGIEEALNEGSQLAHVVQGPEAAVRWLIRLGRQGHAIAFRRAAGLVAARGQLDRALYLYRRAISAGVPVAPAEVSELVSRKENLEREITAAKSAAASGGPQAQRLAAKLMIDAGRYCDASAWLREQTAAAPAARMLEQLGCPDDALDLYRLAAERGDQDALRQAVRLLRATRRFEEGLVWLRDLADAGESRALLPAAGLARSLGRVDEALDLYERSAASGQPKAIYTAAEYLSSEGRRAQAVELFRRLADSGHARSRQRMAELQGDAPDTNA
jgi:hypothetical protein